MVRNYIKKSTRKVTTTAELKIGFKLVNDGWSIRAAARHINVSRQVLWAFLKKKAQQNVDAANTSEEEEEFKRGHTSRQIFTPEQEDALVAYCVDVSKMDYGLTVQRVRQLAWEVAEINQIKVPKNWTREQRAGVDWFQGFKKRHSDKLLIRHHAHRTAQAMAFNQPSVSTFYDQLEEDDADQFTGTPGSSTTTVPIPHPKQISIKVESREDLLHEEDLLDTHSSIPEVESPYPCVSILEDWTHRQPLNIKTEKQDFDTPISDDHSVRQEQTTAQMRAMLHEVTRQLNSEASQQGSADCSSDAPWCLARPKDAGINVVVLSASTPTAVQREMFVFISGHVDIFVHRSPLQSTHVLWQNLGERVRLTPASVTDFVSFVRRVIQEMDSFLICCGVPNDKDLWSDIADTVIDKNLFSETRYSETCRSTNCQLLVSSRSVICESCEHIASALRLKRKRSGDATHSSTPSNSLKKGNLVKR